MSDCAELISCWRNRRSFKNLLATNRLRRLAIHLIAAIALAGCNVNQTANPSYPPPGPDPDPIHDAQTSGFYAGGHGGAR